MRRIMLTVAYDGTAYHGWQRQPDKNSIEDRLDDCLSRLLKEPVRVIGASRTDAGVHALGNIAVFDTNARMEAEKFSYALNQGLPEDIRIRASREVPADFHPRKTDSVKTYEYHILNEEFPNPWSGCTAISVTYRWMRTGWIRRRGFWRGSTTFRASAAPALRWRAPCAPFIPARYAGRA